MFVLLSLIYVGKSVLTHGDYLDRGAQKLTGEYLKHVWAEFSTIT